MRDTQKERRQRHKQVPCREPNAGLNLRSQDHALSQRLMRNCWATQASQGLLIYLRKRDSTHKRVGSGGTEGEGQADSELNCRAWCGARFHDHGIWSWCEQKSSHRLSHPGALNVKFFKPLLIYRFSQPNPCLFCPFVIYLLKKQGPLYLFIFFVCDCFLIV